jgi:hypothetical protein
MARRTVLVLLAALLAATMAPASGETIKREVFAFADWTFPTSKANRFKWYFGAVFQITNVNGSSHDHALVGSGHCVRERQKNGMSVYCRSRRIASGKAAEDFSMDPALLRAQLEIRDDGRKHTVEWVGDGPHGVSQASEVCYGPEGPEGEGQGAGLIRAAITEGKIFGRTLKSQTGRWWDGGYLSSGLMVTSCDDFAERLLAGRTVRFFKAD